jgi:hypothetical protein
MMALAIAALAVKVLVPQGFMAPEHAGAGAFPLVICTAEGRVTLDTGDKHAPAPKPKSDSPCAFAGNLAPPPPPLVAFAGFDRWNRAPAVVSASPEQTPGRGLAAPPPPAIGPPVLI